MRSRLIWRRSATAAGLYASVGLGILGTIVAARVLGLADFGLWATALAVASFFQMLLDITVEETLTKIGFRYVVQEDWGRLRRLFARCVQLKLAGGAAGSACSSPLSRPSPTPSSTPTTSSGPCSCRHCCPLVASVEGGRAGRAPAAAALRHPRLLPGRLGRAAARGHRRRRPVRRHGRGGRDRRRAGCRERDRGLARPVGVPPLPARAAAPARRRPRGSSLSFVARSSAATGVISLRRTLAPLLLGVVAGPTQVGLLRVAQSPQTGLEAASAPVRLILLTEQTHDWERGREHTVMEGVRRYMVAADGADGRGGARLHGGHAVPRARRSSARSTRARSTRRGSCSSPRRCSSCSGGRSRSRCRSAGPGCGSSHTASRRSSCSRSRSILGAKWGVTGAAVAVLVSVARVRGRVGRAARPRPRRRRAPGPTSPGSASAS